MSFASAKKSYDRTSWWRTVVLFKNCESEIRKIEWIQAEIVFASTCHQGMRTDNTNTIVRVYYLSLARTQTRKFQASELQREGEIPQLSLDIPEV